MSTMMKETAITPTREERNEMVAESKPVTQVWFSATGKPMPSRIVTGLTPEERQKVRAGEVVLVRSVQGHDRGQGFDYLQAVWSGGKVRTRKPSTAVQEAWCHQREGRLAEALAEVHRSANDKTYWVCVERITREFCYIPIRAPSQHAAEDAAPGIAWHDMWGDVEHKIEWESDDHPTFEVVAHDTQETKDLPWFIVHAQGDPEEVQTHD